MLFPTFKVRCWKVSSAAKEKTRSTGFLLFIRTQEIEGDAIELVMVGAVSFLIAAALNNEQAAIFSE
jgi:hypothetical protein